MGTRSFISYVKSDNDIRCIYCHYDGYLKHNGRFLQRCYDESNLDELMDRGDLSSLDAFPDMCHAYRDEGETGVDARHFTSMSELKKYANNEFNYFFKDGKWYYWNWDYTDQIKELDTELAKLKKE